MPPFLSPITAPAVAAGRRGLLAVATTPPDLGRWEQGITFQPETCAVRAPLPVVPCSTDDPGDLTDGTDRPAAAAWWPVLLRGFDRCSAMDGVNEDERTARARNNLAATASYQAELELSYGIASQAGGGAVDNPRFNSPDGWISAPAATSGAVSPAVGLAALEQTLSECLHGQRGTIHAPPGVVALWDEAGMVHMDGQVLTTVNDNVVIAGSGYLGDAPDGTPHSDGERWVYGTGLMYQQQGPTVTAGEDLSARFDRSANTIETWVTRLSLVFTSTCCKVAAQIDVTPT